MTVVRGPWESKGATPERRERPERRAAARVRTLLAGHVFSAPGGGMGCTIHDLSESGARLRLEPPVRAPQSFHLMAPRTRSGHAAEVVWREGAVVGVAFSRSYELDDPSLEVEVRLAWRQLNAG